MWGFFHTKPKQKSNYFFFGHEKSVFFNNKKLFVEKLQALIIIFVISGQINDRSLIHNNIYVVYLFFNFHKISKSKMKLLSIYVYIETEIQKIDLI